MTEPDIWGTARKMVECYGPAAHATASQRVMRARRQDDARALNRWLEIEGALNALASRKIKSG